MALWKDAAAVVEPGRLGSRSAKLRAMVRAGTHDGLLIERRIEGCGDASLPGHARDFATLLAASEPTIQDHELIVGGYLALPAQGSDFDLGFYDPHFPPRYEKLLAMGFAGLRDEAHRLMGDAKDPAHREFFEAVNLSYGAACRHVLRYEALARRLAEQEMNPARRRELQEIAEVCLGLTVAPPDSFPSALQLVQFTRLFGAYGCLGRLDQWLYPFYRRDVAAGRLTSEAALELLECFFIKLNQFVTPYFHSGQPASSGALHPNDSLRNITLAGQTRQGADASNELTYLCLEAAVRLMLPEPKLNVRFCAHSAPRLLRTCARVLAQGANVLALYNDDVAVPALERLGIPRPEARDYCNDGCSELIIGGRTFSSFRVCDGVDLLAQTVLRAAQNPPASFDDLVCSYENRLRSWVAGGPSDPGALTFPFFAAAIDDCTQIGAPTAARYSIRGSILGELANAVDGLVAIERFIYGDGSLSWAELVEALDANFVGHEALRQRLRNRAPKYGNDNDDADRVARRLAEGFCRMVDQHAEACDQNRAGPGVKQATGFMLFLIDQKRHLPASPDGRRQGDPVATSLSPSVGMDQNGPTAVIRSASKINLTSASFGSVLDLSLHAPLIRDADGFERFVALLRAFLSLPSAVTLQVNVVDRDVLLRARANPAAPEYRSLIVRVWGFSAVFVDLPAPLQDHVLARTEHALG